MMDDKIHIFAEPKALVRLGYNQEFKNGRTLQQIIKNLAKIYLIMNKEEFQDQWNDSESYLRIFFGAYDIPSPEPRSDLLQLYDDPQICVKTDPHAIWFFDLSKEDLSKLNGELGVWAINTSELTDNYFYLDCAKGYERLDTIKGSKNNGWGNYLEQINKPLPPSNAIVLNDRYLMCNKNKHNALENGFYGLNNLKYLFNELLPKNLRIDFHILIICNHPNCEKETTDEIVKNFINEVKSLRDYKIIVEFVYAESRHKRGMYSNYYWFYVDRGFNAFCYPQYKKLSGENNFNIISYLNNPFTYGDTEYQSAKNTIALIKEQCKDIYMNPVNNPDKCEQIMRVCTDCDDFYFNRLFI